MQSFLLQLFNVVHICHFTCLCTSTNISTQILALAKAFSWKALPFCHPFLCPYWFYCLHYEIKGTGTIYSFKEMGYQRSKLNHKRHIYILSYILTNIAWICFRQVSRYMNKFIYLSMLHSHPWYSEIKIYSLDSLLFASIISYSSLSRITPQNILTLLPI